MVNYVTIQRHTSFCKPLKGWNELILELKDELGMEEVYHFSSATQSKEYQHLELDLIFAIADKTNKCNNLKYWIDAVFDGQDWNEWTSELKYKPEKKEVDDINTNGSIKY